MKMFSLNLSWTGLTSWRIPKLSIYLVIIKLPCDDQPELGISLIRIGIIKSPYADEEIPRVSRALRFASSLSYSVRIPLISCMEVTGCIFIRFSMCVLMQSGLLLYLVSNISIAFL